MGAKGGPKTGGKQKGSLSKKAQAVQDMIEQTGSDPIHVMIEIMNDETNDRPLRLSAAKELAQYAYPKLKALEVSAHVNMELAKAAEDFAALSKEEQIALAEAEVKRLKGG